MRLPEAISCRSSLGGSKDKQDSARLRHTKTQRDKGKPQEGGCHRPQRSHGGSSSGHLDLRFPVLKTVGQCNGRIRTVSIHCLGLSGSVRHRLHVLPVSSRPDHSSSEALGPNTNYPHFGLWDTQDFDQITFLSDLPNLPVFKKQVPQCEASLGRRMQWKKRRVEKKGGFQPTHTESLGISG